MSSPDHDPARALWASGQYRRVSDLILDQSRRLVEWSGLGPGDRVLDVAAGTGAASLPAAEAGARVTATDITPELLEIGERTAHERGAGRFFDAVAPYLPASPPGPAPTDWGEPDHVAVLFGDRVDLVTQPAVVDVDFDGGPDELAELYLTSFPPVLATLAALEGPDQRAAFAEALATFFREEYAAGGVRYDYLLVRATVR